MSDQLRGLRSSGAGAWLLTTALAWAVGGGAPPAAAQQIEIGKQCYGTNGLESSLANPSQVGDHVICVGEVTHADNSGDITQLDASEDQLLDVANVLCGSNPVDLSQSIGNVGAPAIRNNAACSDDGGACQADGTNCQLPCIVCQAFDTRTDPITGLTCPGAFDRGTVHFINDTECTITSAPADGEIDDRFFVTGSTTCAGGVCSEDPATQCFDDGDCTGTCILQQAPQCPAIEDFTASFDGTTFVEDITFEKDCGNCNPETGTSQVTYTIENPFPDPLTNCTLDDTPHDACDLGPFDVPGNTTFITPDCPVTVDEPTLDVATLTCDGFPEPLVAEATCLPCGEENYKCYPAKHAFGTPGFQARFVELEDQFGGRCSLDSENPGAACEADAGCPGGVCEPILQKAVEPHEFCNPVNKTHDGVEDGIENGLPHLMCYKLLNLDEVAIERYVEDIDQFGTETLRVGSAGTLCLPTVKCCEADLGEDPLSGDCIDDPQVCGSLVEAVEASTNHFQCYLSSRAGQCVAGPNEGSPCSSDAQCPESLCGGGAPPANFPGTCFVNDDVACQTDADCPAEDFCVLEDLELVDQFHGECSAGSGVCEGGTADGEPCSTPDESCGDVGTCVDRTGQACLRDADCGSGICLGTGSTISRTWAHCNPTAKQVVDAQGAPVGEPTPIVDAEAHLKCYDIERDGEEAFGIKELLIFNQFTDEGGQHVEVSTIGAKLCEDATKRVVSPGRRGCGLLGIEPLALLAAVGYGMRRRSRRHPEP